MDEANSRLKPFHHKIIGYKCTMQSSGDGFLLVSQFPLFLGEPIPQVTPFSTTTNPDGEIVPMYQTRLLPPRRPRMRS